jgi:hypothetical protein
MCTVERECIKCGATYQIDISDTYDICHDCYLQADKEYKEYVKNFYKSHDKGCSPVCFEEFCDNDFLII